MNNFETSKKETAKPLFEKTLVSLKKLILSSLLTFSAATGAQAQQRMEDVLSSMDQITLTTEQFSALNKKMLTLDSTCDVLVEKAHALHLDKYFASNTEYKSKTLRLRFVQDTDFHEKQKTIFAVSENMSYGILGTVQENEPLLVTVAVVSDYKNKGHTFYNWEKNCIETNTDGGVEEMLSDFDDAIADVQAEIRSLDTIHK